MSGKPDICASYGWQAALTGRLFVVAG